MAKTVVYFECDDLWPVWSLSWGGDSPTLRMANTPIYFECDELWPVWSLSTVGDNAYVRVEADSEQVDRWSRVLREFFEAQKEMLTAVENARNEQTGEDGGT